MAITIEQFASAKRRAEKNRQEYAAIDAYYDTRTSRVTVTFPNDVQISFAPAKVQGLERATAADLRSIELSPSGLGLHFPAIDADVYIPALMHNVLGNKAWMGQVGKAGGAVRSERKAAASRENGKMGGRPPKAA
jgi:hypothetical protein